MQVHLKIHIAERYLNRLQQLKMYKFARNY